MTEPRRVRTQAERDADDHAWRAVAASRPGYATYPQTAPGSPSWWRNGQGRGLPSVRCGHTSPGLLGHPDLMCTRAAGHDGWHRDDDDTRWMTAGPEPTATPIEWNLGGPVNEDERVEPLPAVSFADRLIAQHGQPMRDAIDRARVRYEAEKEAARQPRRRWWHRLTRALAGRWLHVLTPGFLGELSNDIWSHTWHRLTRRNP